MDKKELYDKAKDAYYIGEEIMSDLEFDDLENELGLENKGYVGTHHQKSYTIKHPFIMGSLSKVQVKEDKNHNINWTELENKIMSYLNKSRQNGSDDWYFECTPKFDGCSFEVVIDHMGNLISVSTRGDGTYGVDIKVWFEDEWKRSFESKIGQFITYINKPFKYFVVRGECLVRKSVFDKKYADTFTLPRSFVAGMLGQDWNGTDKQKEMRSDLYWVCYDYRLVNEKGISEELNYRECYDYRLVNENGVSEELNYREHHNMFPGETAPVSVWEDLDLKHLYKMYDDFRKNVCDVALDGFVLKPGVQYRLQDGGRARQEDCVAVKFLPEIVNATLKDVEWNVGKNHEYYPTGILEDVILGGKKVNRVSLANYGNIVQKNIGIGSKLEISLAGDIIPYVYSVKSSGTEIQLPKDSYVYGVHLMKQMSDEDAKYVKFINSVNVIKPDGIGEKVADELYHMYGGTDNILNLMINTEWLSKLDDSKSSQNIINALNERKKTLTLPDIIQSLGITNCGEKNSLWLAKKVSGLNPDTKGIPEVILDVSNESYFQEDVKYFMDHLDVKPLQEEKSDKIYVILTGSPKNCGYNTKGEFLAKHSQFAETTKFDECQMLITDSLDSTSSKMEKAKKKNIPIKTYIDF